MDAMANAIAVAEADVPGQYEYNQMVGSFQSGNYGMAAGWFATMIAQQGVGVVAVGRSTQAQSSSGQLVLLWQSDRH